MSNLKLVIGNKNYSSWSLRPWLLLRHMGIPFEEIYIPIYTPQSASALAKWSPSGLVPALHDGELAVWDSLAICEYLNERFPALQLWPENTADRAQARSMCAEMHAGFSALRQSMSMNIRARRPGKGRTPECMKDVDRIISLWTRCRAQYAAGGPFLFGHFTIADAMYVPVVLRFSTYAVALEGAARSYADTMLALPAMREWIAAAEVERERIEQYEID
jgi:glutathione S-transferase